MRISIIVSVWKCSAQRSRKVRRQTAAREPGPTPGDEDIDMTDKTITLDQLVEISWIVDSIECSDHNLDQVNQPCPIPDTEENNTVAWNSWLAGTCKLIAVDFPGFSYEIDWVASGGDQTLTSAYEFDIEVNEQGENLLDTGDIEIVNDDGDPVTPEEAVRLVGNDIELKVCWESEVRKHLPKKGVEDTDIDEDSDMETITLDRDQAPDVRFTGEKVAHVSSFRQSGPGSQRWTELNLYKTKSGKWVCQEVGMSLWVGEETRYSVHIAETDKELVDSLGAGSLAKDLYYSAGIECVEDID